MSRTTKMFTVGLCLLSFMLTITFTTLSGSETLQLPPSSHITFAPRVYVPYGSGTHAGGHNVIADFNQDGTNDYASIHGWVIVVRLLGANGDGHSGSNTDYVVSGNIFGFASADFNQDGYPDLAASTYAFGNHTLSILLNNGVNGEGTFGSSIDHNVGTYGYDIATGDFNRDGLPDLATANGLANSVYVFLNSGSGTFDAPIAYQAGSNAFHITSINLDQDSYPDLAVINSFDNTVSVFFNSGDGTFSGRSDYAVGLEPRDITSGDFNHDGNPDLAVANTASHYVSVLFNDGNGNLSSRTDYAVGGNPRGIAASDFDLDGYLDLVVGNYRDKTISVLRNDRNGSFVSRDDIPTGNWNESNPYAIASDDLDNDGKPDILVGHMRNESWSVLMNRTPPCLDTDNDGSGGCVDCDDSDSTVFPGAPEIKHDGIDQDCNSYDLTIDVTKAIYTTANDDIRVEAISSLGAAANLELVGHGSMTWKPTQQKWVISVEPVGGNPGTVEVCGIEGCETAQTTVE